VETFRCPVCIGVLEDACAHRCAACGQNMRRRRPRVLGEETRVGARNLPIDRWMLERLHGSTHGRRRSSLPPVAWHGKFTTSPLAEPDFSATPSPVATPLAPPSIATQSAVMEPEHDIDIQTPATVGALALDVYTRPVTPDEELDDAPAIVSVPELDETTVAVDVEAAIPVYEVPVVTEPAAPPLPMAVPHEELDPDVRALVDELYQQARAELSGNDLALFAPLDDHAPTFESDAQLDIDVAPESFEPPAPAVSAPVERDEAQAPIAPEPPAIPPAGSTRSSARGGWVPAFTPNERRRRQTND